MWLSRYDQWRDAPEPRPNNQEDSRNHLDLHPHYSGTLESSKNSGLSSSSFELSQYINGAELSEAPPTSHTGESLSEGPLCQLHGSLRAPIILRARGVGPAEVRHPARRCPFRSCWTADPRESSSVHPGEHRPAGNPQPGGQQGGFSPETDVKEWTNEGYKKKIK